MALRQGVKTMQNCVCVTCGANFLINDKDARMGAKNCSWECRKQHWEKLKSGRLIERFWSKVNKNGPTMPHMDTPCWVWTASKSNKGYGQFGFKPKNIGAHRFAYTITCGNIPDDVMVLHRCDNPPCVRPDHLFLGTHGDNIRDMIAKGRNWQKTQPQKICHGERHHLSKLTVEAVKSIRQLHASGGMTVRQIAVQHGVSEGCAQSIVHRRTWKDVE